MNKTLLLLGISLLLIPSVLAQSLYKLENSNIKAVFDNKGSLIQLTNKSTNWDIIYRKELGQSFEMLIPIEQRRFHNITGKEQTVPQIDAHRDRITFIWSNLKSKHLNKELDITFAGTIQLTDNGLIYSGKVTNNSQYTVEYISWPYWGEVSNPDKKQRMVYQGRNHIKELSPFFSEECGYWGVDYPTQINSLPEDAFMLIRNDTQGIYIHSDQNRPTEMVLGSFELIPGYDILNPEKETLDGQLARIQFKANHVTYTSPNTSYSCIPLNINLYEGSWHKGADIYKHSTNKKQKNHIKTFAKEPFIWQKINISNANDLIQYAEKASQCNINALLINNDWYNNGTGNTINQLGEAIDKCKQLGIKIILSLNFSSMPDYRSQRYLSAFEECMVTDPFNLPYDRRILCPLHNNIKKVMNDFLSDNTVMKADGFIINDNNHQAKTFFCFNPNHNHKVPSLTTTGNIELDETFTESLKSHSDKAVFGYGFQDCQNDFYEGYQISSNIANDPIHRYINPYTTILSVIDVRTARRDMNRCIRYRYNMLFDLQFHNNQLDSYPHILQYARQIQQFNERWADYIWNGKFIDTQEAIVTGNDISYSVYEAENGKKAVIVTNNSEKESTTITVKINNHTGKLNMATPEHPSPKACNGTVTIAPQSVTIIVEA